MAEAKTFFESREQKFADVSTEPETDTVAFLACCTGINGFFDILGGTAFYPAKSDIAGNIAKLSKKLEGDATLTTIQKMIKSEIDAGTTAKSGSATDALCWLKRALTFIKIILSNVAAGEKSVKAAANDAYVKSLRPHHNFLVKGVFSMAMSACPTYESLVKSLCGDSGADDATLLAQMKETADAFGAHLDVLNTFYDDNKIAN